jgi:hypothetical protein
MTQISCREKISFLLHASLPIRHSVNRLIFDCKKNAASTSSLFAQKTPKIRSRLKKGSIPLKTTIVTDFALE